MGAKASARMIAAVKKAMNRPEVRARQAEVRAQMMAVKKARLGK